MKCQAETHYPRGHRFPVPQDKGNVGSGDEIGIFYLSEKRSLVQNSDKEPFTDHSRPESTLLLYLNFFSKFWREEEITSPCKWPGKDKPWANKEGKLYGRKANHGNF